MKKSRNGLTLIEVLVAISVFSIVLFALISSVILMKKVVNRQEEYAKLEMVCNDIKVYYEKFGAEWDDVYFKGNSEKEIGYLNSKFQVVDNENEAKYIIEFSDNTIVKIYSKVEDKEKVYVENILLSDKKGYN